jgi:hypothetical protein
MEVGQLGHIDLAELVAEERIKTAASLKVRVEALQEKVVEDLVGKGWGEGSYIHQDPSHHAWGIGAESSQGEGCSYRQSDLANPRYAGGKEEEAL